MAFHLNGQIKINGISLPCPHPVRGKSDTTYESGVRYYDATTKRGRHHLKSWRQMFWTRRPASHWIQVATRSSLFLLRKTDKRENMDHMVYVKVILFFCCVKQDCQGQWPSFLWIVLWHGQPFAVYNTFKVVLCRWTSYWRVRWCLSWLMLT